MVFELTKVKFDNLLRSTRRLGNKVHQQMDLAMKSDESFKEHLKQMDTAVKEGDIDGVLKSFKAQAQDTTAEADAVMEAEKVDSLYSHQIADDIKKEIEELKDLHHMVAKIKVDPKLFSDQKAISLMEKHKIRPDEKILKEAIEKVYSNLEKELDNVHKQVLSTLQHMEKKLTNQRWGERLADLRASSGFLANYNAEQAGRGLRWKTSTLTKDIKDANKEINKVDSLMKRGIESPDDLKMILDSMTDIDKELKEEESDLKNMMTYVTQIIDYSVFLFFKMMAHYETMLEEEKTLGEQKFPEDKRKEMQGDLKVLYDHVRDESLETARVSRSTLQKAA